MSAPAQLVSFDTETTGVDVENDRIVTAFVGLFDVAADGWVEQRYWLLDPGVEIAPEATAVHGYSNEDVQFAGSSAAEGVFSIAQQLDIYDRRGLATVAYNGAFDFTLLDREFRRHYPGGRPFAPHRVIDPMVLDKGADPYRKGGRKLVTTAAHYGVPVEENAHDAAADCLMAARLAVKLLAHRQFYRRSLDELHEYQQKAYRTQAEGLAKFWRKNGRGADADTIRFNWPIDPITETEHHA